MLPLWVRKFIVDFVETGLAVLLVANLAIPTTADEASKVAASVTVGIVAAAVSAFRRAIPDFKIWLRNKLNVPVSDDGT